jgi:hypothetical protein
MRVRYFLLFLEGCLAEVIKSNFFSTYRILFRSKNNFFSKFLNTRALKNSVFNGLKYI